jgi:hypothetical protein
MSSAAFKKFEIIHPATLILPLKPNAIKRTLRPKFSL